MYKVLLIEDEELIRKGLRYTFDWLKLDCVVVGEAANGEEGLEQIKELLPDLLIIDVNMPKLDGISMMKQIPPEIKCCCILVTGYDDFYIAKEAIHLGVVEYLLKPVDHEQLTEAIERGKHQVDHHKRFDALVQANEKQEPEPFLLPLQLPSQTSRYVSKMLAYLERNYHRKITMQHVADELGISGSYLNKLFKQETTYTFNDFLNRYRVEQAMNKLKSDEGGKVYTIAMDVGFKDYKYFIHIFKKYTNCTPTQFQELFKANKVNL